MFDISTFILRESWWVNQVVYRRIPTSARFAIRDWLTKSVENLRVKEHGGISEVLFIMDCGGVGKTSALMDAAAECGMFRVHSDLEVCEGIVRVGARAREFFAGRTMLSRCEVLRGYQTIFEAELVEVLDRIRDAMSEPVDAYRPVDLSIGSRSLRDAWFELLRKADSRTIVIHFDGVHKIFNEVDLRPSNDDLVGGDEDLFDVEAAPRLVFVAFLSALAPLIHSEPRIRWAFSGLPPNLTPTLNAPADLTVVDLAPSITYFEPADMYQVFLSHINPLQPPQPTVFESASEKMKFCMRQVSGPPRMIQCFFNALFKSRIRSVDEMCLRWDAVEKGTVTGLSQLLRSLGNATREDLMRCLLVPFRERLFGERISIDRSNGYWNEMIVKGFIRLSRGDSLSRDGTRCVFSLPYLFLQKVLCLKLGVSHLVIHAFTNLAVCLERTPTAYMKDRMLETLFVASLVESSSYTNTPVNQWLMHRLCVSNWSEIPCELASPLMEGLGGGMSVDSPVHTSEEPNASGIEFEAFLGRHLEDPIPERVRVAVRVTFQCEFGARNEAYSHLDYMLRMVRSAVERFDATQGRTVLVFGGPNLRELSSETRHEFLRILSNLNGTDIPINRPLLPEENNDFCGAAGHRFAVFYIPGSDPIWQHMGLPVHAMQEVDTDEIRRFIIQRFIVNHGVRLDSSNRSLIEWNYDVCVPPEKAEKRKANLLDDFHQ